MEQKIEKYVQELLSQKVGELNDENGSILIDLIKYIYNDADILMFTFPFLDKIDDFLVRPENLDLIEKLFRIIKKENADFDIITSGNFGEWIYNLIDSGKIKFDGNVVVMSGKIRNMEGEKKNPVEIIKKKYDIILVFLKLMFFIPIKLHQMMFTLYIVFKMSIRKKECCTIHINILNS